MPGDLSQHILDLATELLEDIELNRVPIRTLVLKASRLARLAGDEEVLEWLTMELHGYTLTEVGVKYVTWTGRWGNREANTGYWQGVGEIEAQIEAWQAQLKAMTLPNLSGEWVSTALRETRNDLGTVAGLIAKFAGIREKVIALLHRFAVTRYYELAFSERQAEFFEHARRTVDQLLSPLTGDVLSKVDSIYRRLGEGDPEAVSQALNTCRRLIDAVADAVLPSRDQTVRIDDQEVGLGTQHVQNRLNQYVRERTDSNSRRARMRRTLSDLYDRVAVGVHRDVTLDEARFLFLNTYLFLGEILTLPNLTATSAPLVPPALQPVQDQTEPS